MPWVAWTLSEEGPPLPRHPDARLTPRGRALLCERVGGGMRVSDATAMAGEPRARGPVTRVRQGRGRPGEPLHADARKVARHTQGRRARGPRARLRVEEGRRDVVPAHGCR